MAGLSEIRMVPLVACHQCAVRIRGMLIQILIWIGLGLLGGRILAKKGYPPGIGVFVGLFCGPFGLVLSAVLPKTAAGRQLAGEEKQTRRELKDAAELRPCPNCGRMNSVATPICARCDHRFGVGG